MSQGCVELNPAFRDYQERSVQVDKVLRELRAKNAFVTLKGWRDEVHISHYILKPFIKFYSPSLIVVCFVPYICKYHNLMIDIFIGSTLI